MERYKKPGNSLEVAGEKVGITFSKTRRVIRTLDGHRLHVWSKGVDGASKVDSDELMEAFFNAYFVNGKDLSRAEELLSCVEACGLDKAAAEAFAGPVHALLPPRGDDGGREEEPPDSRSPD